jgi:hypothetical protein
LGGVVMGVVGAPAWWIACLAVSACVAATQLAVAPTWRRRLAELAASQHVDKPRAD